MSQVKVLSVLVAVVCAFFGSLVAGDTIYVSTCGDNTWSGTGQDCVGQNGPKATIQAAINAAVDGDTVIVQPGEYTGYGNRDIDFLGKAVTVRSVDPNDIVTISSTTINSEGTLLDRHRGFYLHEGEGPDSVISGLTITNGYAPQEDFEGIYSYGGGIFCIDSNPTITNCIITNNNADDYGGGIGCCDCSPTITNCYITDNSAYWGGGLICWFGKPKIINCVIAKNTVGGCGIIKYSDGNTTHNWNVTVPSIINCTITENSGYAGIDLFYSSAVITNCIIWNNSPYEILVDGEGEPTVSYSDVRGGWPGTSNIDADPEFLTESNYHLVTDSPCIDAGVNIPEIVLAVTDIEENSRVQDGNGDLIAITDMGAYEYQYDFGVPLIVAIPSEFEFYSYEGFENPPVQILTIRNGGDSDLNWEISADCGWLEVLPSFGSCGNGINEVRLRAITEGLSLGKYHCWLSITDEEALNSPQTVEVILNIFREGERHVPLNYDTIQAAINHAANGDTVLVADGVYSGLGNRDIDLKGKSITVKSVSGPENCIIDCQGSSVNMHRGFYILRGEGLNTVIDGFTVTNGYAKRGGGMRIDESSPRIMNCIFRNNYSISGGGISGAGIYIYFSNSRVTNCIFENNEAEGDGGGMFSEDSASVFTNCIFVGNSADDGQAIFNYRTSNLVLSNCILWDNAGRNIWNQSNSELTVINCDLEGGIGRIGNAGGSVTIDAGGNINKDPFFIDPIYGDFHLVPWSPCIDAGTNNPPGGLPATDIEGEVRPIDGDNDGIAVADIGVYETLLSVEPVILLSEDKYTFSVGEGRPNPEDQILLIRNRGGGILNWEFSYDCEWMKVNPVFGSSDKDGSEVSLGVDIAGLIEGSYSCELMISAPDAANSPKTVLVNLNVLGPIISVIPSEMKITVQKGDPNIPDYFIYISNAGGNAFNWEITVPSECDWLEVDPLTGQTTDEIDEVKLNVDSAELEHGFHNCDLVVTSNEAENSPQTVQVILHVYTEGELHVPEEYETIQAGIDAASEGDEVIVADGTYSGNGNRDIDFKAKAITVRSERGPDNCIIHYVKGEYGYHSGFYFHSGEGNNSVVDGFTITNADQSGIRCGAKYGSSSSPTIQNCIIRGNSNGEYRGGGGGISCWNGSSPVIKDCEIVNNVVFKGWWISGGGGIFCEQSEMTISNCLIKGNSVVGFEGECSGGGIYSSYSNVIIENSIIADNTSTGDFYFYRLTSGGGGVYCDNSGMVVVNSSIVNNSTKDSGGGVLCSNESEVTIINCILWGNTGQNGVELAVVSISDYFEPAELTVSYSDIQGGQEEVYVGEDCTLNWDESNIDADPLFVEFEPSSTECISYWKFDEDEGGIAFDSAGNYNGLVSGAIWTVGQVEGALSFDGDWGYVRLGGYYGLNQANKFTISFWIKPEHLPFNGHRGIIGIGSSGQRSPWIWGKNGTEHLHMQFETTTGGAADCNLEMGQVVQDQWSYIAVTWDGNTCTSYINGVFDNSDETTGSILVNSDEFNYLGHIEGYGFWKGAMDEVLILSRCLSVEEIQELYQEGLNGNGYDYTLALNNDYRLRWDSPCIDAGMDAGVYEDMEGNVRPWDCVWVDNNGSEPEFDMGAYEFSAVEVAMKLTPRRLNPQSKGRWLKAHIVMPEGYAIEDIDTEGPVYLEPLGVESERINVFVNDDGLVELVIGFAREDLCGAEDFGPGGVAVVGRLMSGQYFYGTDEIKVVHDKLGALAVLVSYWLESDCRKPKWCEGADVNQDGVVNLVDFCLIDGCSVEVMNE